MYMDDKHENTTKILLPIRCSVLTFFRPMYWTSFLHTYHISGVIVPAFNTWMLQMHCHIQYLGYDCFAFDDKVHCELSIIVLE